MRALALTAFWGFTQISGRTRARRRVRLRFSLAANNRSVCNRSTFWIYSQGFHTALSKPIVELIELLQEAYEREDGGFGRVSGYTLNPKPETVRHSQLGGWEKTLNLSPKP